MTSVVWARNKSLSEGLPATSMAYIDEALTAMGCLSWEDMPEVASSTWFDAGVGVMPKDYGGGELREPVHVTGDYDDSGIDGVFTIRWENSILRYITYLTYYN